MSNLNRDDVIAGMKAAAERMGLDLEDLQEMIVDVLEDCSEKAQMLVKAAKAGDSAQIKTLAHDIKGATANYGLPEASSLALQIEKGHEDIPKEPISELVTHFEALIGLNLEQVE